MLKSEIIQNNPTLPEYFSKNGYYTLSTGKIFHKHETDYGFDNGQWAFDHWEQIGGNDRVITEKQTKRNAAFSWGPTQAAKEQTPDFKSAMWAVKQLQNDFEKPFFMAIGISKPHLPWHVPQEYFDRYPLEDIIIPEYHLDDLDDILTPDGKKKFTPNEDFEWAIKNEKRFKEAVRAYMAASTYADECVGEILKGLNNSKYKDNTIVIIWGDHGWHLGEKLRFRKATLWQESTRLPLIIKTPGMKVFMTCNRTVNLIDLYPTLIDLCKLSPKKDLDGRSIKPLIQNPGKSWPYPSITTRGFQSHTINNERWRYTLYEDGTEELYDHLSDPMEIYNLSRSSEPFHLEVKMKLNEKLPKYNAKPVPSDESKNWQAPLDTVTRDKRSWLRKN